MCNREKYSLRAQPCGLVTLDKSWGSQMLTHLWAWRDAVMCDSAGTNSHAATPWRRVRDSHTHSATHAHLEMSTSVQAAWAAACFWNVSPHIFSYFFFYVHLLFPFLLRTQFTSVTRESATPGSAQMRCQILVWHSGLPASDRTLTLLEGRQRGSL